MNKFLNDNFTILNYQGSKKNLMDFIFKNTVDLIDDKKAILDMFSGSGSVGYGFKRYFQVFANDSEYYSYVISKALLEFDSKSLWQIKKDEFSSHYEANKKKLYDLFEGYCILEKNFLESNNADKINEFYNNYPTVWNQKLNIRVNNIKIKNIEDIREHRDSLPYLLFTTYYGSTYFGIEQSIEIDSIRYAIEKIENVDLKYMLLSALFFSMKESVFSKDGHMAQPLDIIKNATRLKKVRKKSINELFQMKIKHFLSDKYIVGDFKNKAYNFKVQDIMKLDNIKNNTGFVYADPPYTDMQYSRYYHLLNTVSLYDYDYISFNKGSYSKGLYRKNRFQSPLSQKSKAFISIENIIKYCKENRINLAFSYAYPRNTGKQATNRYTMNIEDIIKIAENTSGRYNCNIVTEKYEHSNNRNNSNKKVLEYLITCKNR